MISHDQFAKALDRHRIVLSNLQINALLNDLLPNPQSGFGVGGVQVWGDSKSIKAVRHWQHDSTAMVPALRQRMDEGFTEANVETAMCLWEALDAERNNPNSLARQFTEALGAVEARHTVIGWVEECEAEWEADRKNGTEQEPYDWGHCPGFLARKLKEVCADA